MIIVDDNAHRRKSAQQEQAQQAAQSSSGSGPSHSNADLETGHDPIPDAEAPPPYEASPLLARQRDVKSRTRGRFIRACFLAIFIYVLGGMIVGLVAQRKESGTGDRPSRSPAPSHRPVPSTPQNPPEAPTSSRCFPVSGWSRDRHETSFKFDIHLASNTDIIRLLATDGSYGKVTIQDDGSDEQTLVYVEASEMTEQALSTAEVCLAASNGNATIEVRSGIHGSSDGKVPKFNLVVSLPFTKRSSGRRTYKQLEARMPLFEYQIDNLEAFHFENVTLLSASFPITSESLYADVVELRTANAAISGSFDVSQSLILESINAPIKARVSLRSGTQNTTLSMKTANTPIEADINLHSSSSSGFGGVFDIRSETVNAGSTVLVHTAPVDSLLNVNAVTAFGDVRVHLPAAYEGSFAMETALNRVDLTVDDKVADPSGTDRRRQVVSSRKTGSNHVGEVAWIPRRAHAQKGVVKLHTAVGRATLSL